MRFDVLTGEWVTIAAHRMDRTFLPAGRPLPAVPDAARPRAVGDPAPTTTTWSCSRTGSRRFAQAAPPTCRPTVDGESLWPLRPGGRAVRGGLLHQRPRRVVRRAAASTRVRTVVEAWADRTAELSALPGVEQVFPFENRGQGDRRDAAAPARADLRLPVRHAAHRAAARAGRRRTGSAPGATCCGDVLDAERKAGTRVVLDGEHWTAYVPAAARWPVEVHLAPHRGGARPRRPRRGRARRAGRHVPRPAAPARPVLRPRVRPALHRGLAPGARRTPDASWRGCTCSCSRCAARRAS